MASRVDTVPKTVFQLSVTPRASGC